MRKLSFYNWVSKCEAYAKKNNASTFCATMEHWGYDQGRVVFKYTLCLSYTSNSKTVQDGDWREVLKKMDAVLAEIRKSDCTCPICGDNHKSLNHKH